MKNIIFEKPVNDEAMRMHFPRCTDTDIKIMEMCGWHIGKVIYDSEKSKTTTKNKRR